MAKTFKLISPPGYGPLVPINKQIHRGTGLSTTSGFRWCSALNASFLNVIEISRAALDYPIAFTREDRSGEFVPVSVFGLKAGQNLFVDAQGRWLPTKYIPAYIRRHPFCIADAPPQNGVASKKLICVEDGAMVPSKQPLFDDQGEPTAAWPPILALLESSEAARQQTRVFARRLEALGLLAPFDAIAVPNHGERARLTGLYRVDEAKLGALAAKDLRTLLKKGELRAVYAHLISLDNFSNLLDLSQIK